MTEPVIERIEQAVNRGQHWLTIDAKPGDAGTLLLVANIHGHFAAVAESSDAGDVAKALGGLFGGLHGAVVTAAGGLASGFAESTC